MLDSGSLTKLRFSLLGGAELKVEGHASSRLSTQKGLALLIYLALHCGRPVSRATLADLLWGDRPDGQARQNLRQCIWTLRRDLGPGASLSLIADDHTVTLKSDAVQVDALQFTVLANANHVAERSRCLEIPWGPFLDKFAIGSEAFDNWVLSERSRLDALATRTFAELVEHFESSGAPDQAILALERLVAIDSSDESRHRRLLALEARHRGRDPALARAKLLAASLKHEFDAEPEAATVALIEQIRAGSDTVPRPSPLQSQSKAISVTSVVPAPGRQPPLSRASMRRRFSPRNVMVAAALICVAVSSGVLALTQWHALSPTVANSEIPSPANSPAIVDTSHHSFPAPQIAPQATADRVTRGVTTVAVLPFVGHGGSEDPSYDLADRMTDDLIISLSRIPGLRIVSRQSALAYKHRHVDAKTIAAELGANYLLEGSVRLQGQILRTSVGLISAKNGLHIWNARFTHDNADRLVVQDGIVAQLMRNLQIELYAAESDRLRRDDPVSALLFEGWRQVTRAHYDATALNQAEMAFTEVLSQLPKHPRALTGMAAVYVIKAQQFDPNPEPLFARAEAILQEVIARDLASPGTYGVLGQIHKHRGRFEQAISAFETALSKDPNFAQAHAQIGHTLFLAGRSEYAMTHIDQAKRLSPGDPLMPLWLTFTAQIEIERDDATAAIENLKRANKLMPRNICIAGTLAAAYALAGQMDDARMAIEKLRAAAPHLSDGQILRWLESNNAYRPRLQTGLRAALTASMHSTLNRLPNMPTTLTAPDRASMVSNAGRER